MTRVGAGTYYVSGCNLHPSWQLYACHSLLPGDRGSSRNAVPSAQTVACTGALKNRDANHFSVVGGALGG
ncbi:MAG: hypothetical protein LGB01_00355 [Sulfurovum sp.]|nr:hypothetical protein [Sulfurovum sp.]